MHNLRFSKLNYAECKVDPFCWRLLLENVLLAFFCVHNRVASLFFEKNDRRCNYDFRKRCARSQILSPNLSN